MIFPMVLWPVAELRLLPEKNWSESPRDNISGKTI
jgi:hypothetical protein